jgi:hypothetical protein
MQAIRLPLRGPNSASIIGYKLIGTFALLSLRGSSSQQALCTCFKKLDGHLVHYIHVWLHSEVFSISFVHLVVAFLPLVLVLLIPPSNMDTIRHSAMCMHSRILLRHLVF